MLQNLRDRASEEKGFTLIELLVVILIIGILAAIALPSFLGQKDKARDSAAKSDARNAVTQMESCLADGASVATCGADTQVLGTGDSIVAFTAVGTQGYTLTATAEQTGTTFAITKSDSTPGGYTRACGPAANQGKGGCPTGGVW